MFKSKRVPLTQEQKDLVLRILGLYGFGPGSLMEPLRARISAGVPLTENQGRVLRALLERTAEQAGRQDAESLKILIKHRWS
jgi:hypothetical protein